MNLDKTKETKIKMDFAELKTANEMFFNMLNSANDEVEKLKEINAELTKREQKHRTCIKSLLNSDTRKSKERAIFKAKELLKGDSDE